MASHTNISRRNLLFSGAAAMAARFLELPVGAAPPARPNILFMAMDDMNDWLNCVGGYPGRVYTPNLDRLAARGVLFTNAHCAAPVCNPSRVALLTGVRPSRSGVYNLNNDWRLDPVLKDSVTIPHYFRENGYYTSGAGKIFHALSWLNYGYGGDWNDPDAWNDYYPSKTQSMPFARFPATAKKIDKPQGWEFIWDRVAKGIGQKPEIRVPYYMDWAPFDESQEFADQKVADWAVSQLRRKYEKPFFLGVGIFKPHIPWFVPKKYFDMYPLEKIQLPYIDPKYKENTTPAGLRMSAARRKWHEWIVANKEWRKAVQGYLAAITFADAQIGRVLDQFDASPYAKNTITVLWSDNGFQLGERETWEKFTLWEESTRVPLMVSAPGVTKPGTRCTHAVSLLDIYPTLVELSGFPHPPQELDGISLVPQLRNPATPRPHPVVITNGWGNDAIRSDRWRYIHYRDGSEELYDEVKDPAEAHNLANEAQYATVKSDLGQWIPKDPRKAAN